MRVHGINFTFTKEAYEYLNKHEKNPEPNCLTCYPEGIPTIKKVRKNKSKRKGMPLELKLVVYDRSSGICEEGDCKSRAAAIHHIKSVYEYPELQFELANLIHICLSHHADKHKNMSETMFIKNKFITLFV